MSEPMTKDEIREALRRQGVGLPAIERVMADPLAIDRPLFVAPRRDLTVCGRPLETWDTSVYLTLPWSALCSDNERKVPRLKRSKTGKLYPYMVTTSQYKTATELAKDFAREAMQGRPIFDQPLALVARVYRPKGRRCDPVNLAKLVGDALSKIVFTDDKWLKDSRWVDMGPDASDPRAELTITPLVTEAAA